MRRLILVLAVFPQLFAAPARVKELVSVEGVRDNQLIGYGLVVGLNGTGDKRQTFFSAQTLANMLERMGVQVNGSAMLVRNTAAVMVTATLPPFAQPGQKIDVTVAAIGDATNLQGGLLVTTPLKAADGQVYAVAQGAVVTGGFVARGGAGNSSTLNHPTTGRTPAGALVERAAPSVPPGPVIRLQLRQADFTTAVRIAQAINQHFPGAPEQTGLNSLARPESSGVVSVRTPPAWNGRSVEFLAELENLAIEADRVARIVLNERTGTIVLGKEVRISPVAIMHGALTVEIQTTFDVSQPAPFSEGQTTVVPNVGVNVKEERAKNVVLKKGATVEELVRALQAIGTTPRDVIAILQNLRAAGAIEADLEVI
ncbi:MAG: flagellar basal body P-ring protein FlgI [Bryobacter sp.]|jgi:flagellar P-ring protein precursor FlgI|nr:flagellar basal body P-ring protein FlgI [Bryobacter sp.]